METRRRSAAGAAGEGVGLSADGASSAPPHSAQKRWPAVYGLPHDGQVRVSAVPHSTQNFAVGVFSVAQDGHVTVADSIYPECECSFAC